MDNSNNPNSPNNPNPNPLTSGITPPSPADLNPTPPLNPPPPSPAPEFPSQPPSSAPSDNPPPADTWTPPSTPPPAGGPTDTWTPPSTNATMDIPSPDLGTGSTPPSPTFSPFNQANTFTPSTPPPAAPSEPISGSPTSSPLDNPLDAPLQPPPIDGSNQPSLTPTWTPVQEPISAPPPFSSDQTPTISEQTTAPNIPSTIQEPAPTDLSHLITSSQPGATQSTVNQPETLVVPSSATPEVPNIATETNHKGIPKWVIGVGIGLLLVVAGASGYFILGIGQPPKNGSMPATQAPNTTQVKPPPPVATPVPQPSPETTGSANFGQLDGSGSQQATSAADLLRQRQQGR